MIDYYDGNTIILVEILISIGPIWFNFVDKIKTCIFIILLFIFYFVWLRHIE
jgi:hypothetical protein